MANELTKLRTWGLGLLDALIGGAAGAVGSVIVDPVTYNFHEGLPKLGMMALVFALVSGALYLKNHPLKNALDDDPSNDGFIKLEASMLLVIILASFTALAVPACAALRTAPGQAATTEAARLSELSQIADTSKKVLEIVSMSQTLEITLNREGVIPMDVHMKLQTAYLTFAESAKVQLAIAGDINRSDADRRSALAAFIKAADSTVVQLEPHLGGEKAVALRAVVVAVRATLVSLRLSL